MNEVFLDKDFKKRVIGLDVLRLLLMFMICMLHVLNQGGMLWESAHYSASYKTLWFLYTASFCSVNAFGILSGYVSKNSKHDYSKIIYMWLQVYFYSFILSLALYLFQLDSEINISIIKESFFPVLFNRYWYFSSYFPLFFVMPFIDKTLNDISEKQSIYLLVFIFFVSAYEIVNGPFKLSRGYSFIWITILYIVGILIRRIRLFDRINNIYLVLLWTICIFFTWFLVVYRGNDLFFNLVSPLALLEGIILNVLFSRIKIKSLYFSKVSKYAFGIYLFQCNRDVFRNLKDALVNYVSDNVFLTVLYALLFSSIIFILGLIIDRVRFVLFEIIRVKPISVKTCNMLKNIFHK